MRKPVDALFLVFLVLVLITVLTYIIPAGSYERIDVDGRQVLNPNVFKSMEQHSVSLFRMFSSLVDGFVQAGNVIAFVFLIGGAFGILHRTGALESGLHQVVELAFRRPKLRLQLIALLMIFFSLAGNTFGMAEEVLVFILITIPLARQLKLDPIVAVAIPFVGAGAGFAGAAFNPFTVGIAQGIAEVTPFSGAGYRMIIWGAFTAIAIIFTIRYALRIEKNPSLALAFPNQTGDLKEAPIFSNSRKIILILFGLSLVILMYGVAKLDWYISEIAALFVIFGLVAGITNRLSISDITSGFTEGARDMLHAALIIGLARAVMVVAEEGYIIDSILYGLSNLTGHLPQWLAVQSMFILQGVINFFVPSGSGQAALTMPVMAPLSDLLGISRQTAVLAYQFGDGIFNLIIPTSGVTMGVLSLAGIPFKIWFRWAGKLVIWLSLAAMLFLAFADWGFQTF